MVTLDPETLKSLDTGRPGNAPSLDGLPEDLPERPTEHGWACGTRDWYWSGLRRTLDSITGGSPNHTDEDYPLGATVLELLEKRARQRGLGFPPDAARKWLRGGLKASSFSFSEEGEIQFRGPADLPEVALRKAAAFCLRRADRALDLFGTSCESAEPDPDLFQPEPRPEESPDGEPPAEEAPDEEPTGAEASEGKESEEDPQDSPEETGEEPRQEPGKQGTLF